MQYQNGQVQGSLYSGKDLKLKYIIQDPEDLDFELKCLLIYQKIILFYHNQQKSSVDQDI